MAKMSSSTDKLARTIDSLQVAVRKQQLEHYDTPAGAYIAMFPAGGKVYINFNALLIEPQ